MDRYDAAALAAERCRPLRGAEHRLEESALRAALAALPDWRIEGGQLVRELRFADYHRTMAFVNAVAFVAHVEDHHPDLEVSYGSCRVRYATHDVGGISHNDLICAAKVDVLAREAHGRG